MEKYKLAKLYDASGDLSKRWYVEYFFVHPETKKFIRFKENISEKLKTRSDRRQRAAELMHTINDRLKKGFNPFTYQEKRSTTVAQALDFVYELKKSYCRKKTAQSYKSNIGRVKQWLIDSGQAELQLKDFTPQMAQQFIDENKMHHHLSNRTHNDYIVHVRNFFKVLKKRQWIYLNPFDDIEKLPVTEPDLISFSEAELDMMVNSLPLWDFNLYAIASLIFYGFLRPQEIVRLRIRHLLLDKNLILVPGEVSKNKKSEVIQIPPGLRPILQAMDLDYPSDWYIFSTKLYRGTQEIAPTRIDGFWSAYAKEVGIGKTIYALKHTGNGMAIDAGINLRDLQLHNRHHSLDMTQRYADRFRKHTSEELNEKFPDLIRLASQRAKRMIPSHCIPLGDRYNPDLSKN